MRAVILGCRGIAAWLRCVALKEVPSREPGSRSQGFGGRPGPAPHWPSSPAGGALIPVAEGGRGVLRQRCRAWGLGSPHPLPSYFLTAPPKILPTQGGAGAARSQDPQRERKQDVVWVTLRAGLQGASVVPKPRAAQRSERQGQGMFRAVGKPRAIFLQALCGHRALPPGPSPALLSSQSVVASWTWQ